MTVESILYQGSPALRIITPQKSEATILLHGAHVVSWKPFGGEERLFMSEKSSYAAGAAIRGGVPICFPQFAVNGPLASHGFARNHVWEQVEARTGNDHATARLKLTDNAETRALWPHAFSLEMTVSVSNDRLDMELEVTNTDDKALSFNAALHTYFLVKEAEETSVEGLHGQRYFDKVTGNDNVLETGTHLAVDREINRIYYETQNALLLRETSRALGINAENMPDTVVWNPWEERCATIEDMPANGFRHMVCVEAGAIAKPVELKPNESWWGRQTLVML